MTTLATVPYDTVDTVLNFVRALANDAGLSIAGSELADTQPATFPLFNLGWRTLQRRLTNRGVGTFIKTTVLTALPVAATLDPAIFCYLSFTGYFDGVLMHGVQSNPPGPILPPDMVGPLKLWERQSGTTQRMSEMYQSQDGLPSRGKLLFNREWIWENDLLQFCGATQVNDMQLRYNAWFPDIQPDQNGLGTNQVPLLRCAEALAACVLFNYALSRGSPQIPAANDMAEKYIREMTLGTVRQKQRANHRRRPYGSNAMQNFGFYQF